ncbi:tetraacyldisaccharide 4'-kinase [Luteimonas sp. S4-F44]|uniref:tetraacyldisaccharide 4'-kinase n=1 Tax=Luteimonas sp. S4-F44 TaxID=2925842 RepID=UPI001F53625B|nr:tetraacyldisaccharide 4'-kinase [Luteimonas sp. S4-F44]UNK43697.1 tetraacyldisaccharide 4'-kinase [Luteimonas sp. S4-F44]
MKAPGYWFDGSRPPLHARLLAHVYARASAWRRKWLRTRKVARPVLVIGNLIAGGSGKTPLTIAIVERLQAAGWTPGVASRGYGRDEAGTPRWVEPVSDPRWSGDEPVLIAARTGAKVRVDADRVAAANALIAAGCDIVVCDDGLQHYRLQRDVEIEVIDGRRRYGNGALIPAGPLREPVERGARCDFRVLNAGMDDSLEPDFGEWPMRLETAHALPLAGGRARPLSAFAGQRVHAVAGIGDPERFFDTLRRQRIAVVPHAFADHHRYTPEDLHFGSDLPVLMTEKDAVKCMRFAGERHYSVPIAARLPEAFWIALFDRLEAIRNPAGKG